MKITQIVCQILRIQNVEAKTASSQDAVLVRVRTDTGLEGIGEADASPEVVKAIVDAPFSHNIACGLREILVGENPLETERLWQKMYRRTMYFGRTSVDDHRHGRRRHGAVGSQGQALRRADPSAAGRQAARPDSRRMPRSCSAATAARRPTSAAAGARPATRPSSSAGSRWARARRSTSIWSAAPARDWATARC